MNAIRDNESDPVHSPDPIAFIYVFARVLGGLVPSGAVATRKGDIYGVMNELGKIVTHSNTKKQSHSRRECINWICALFSFLHLDNQNRNRALVTLINCSDTP